MNTFRYGDLWDLDFNGGRWRIIAGDLNIEASRDGVTIINLWL